MITKLNQVVESDIRCLQNLQKKLIKTNNLVSKCDYAAALRNVELLQGDINTLYPQESELLKKYKVDLNDEFRKYKLNFQDKLKQKCKEANLFPVNGDATKGFKIRGLIEIKVDFDKGNASIGTRQKTSKINSLKIDDILSYVVKTYKRLYERKFDPAKFIEELYIAHTKVSNNKPSETVLLRAVQRAMWIAKQKELFWMTFNNEKLSDYPTDEFSVDLGKLIADKDIETKAGYRLMLSEGADGVIVYDSTDNFKSFKFINFRKRGT